MKGACRQPSVIAPPVPRYDGAVVIRDTIFALSSGRPPAGVAIVRMSGDKALRTLADMASVAPPPRIATLVALRGGDGRLLDRALALCFPAPRSFTGEDVAELHLHGGAAVIAAVLDDLAARDGLRLAGPGEFSRRAFDNGKLDLTQAEGLADLIAAETEAQRRQALAQAGGVLRDRVENWRVRLLALQAAIEADLDFSDESDVGGAAPPADLAPLAAEIAATLADDGVGERLRDGFTIVVTGPPNVGKSSIINALSKKDVSIVSPRPGTTRDVVEVPMTLAGLPVTLLDTAGLRDSDDPVEAEGIRRARARAAEADLVLVVHDASCASSAGDPAALEVFNKVDCLTGERNPDALYVSARSGEGLDDLKARLAAWATHRQRACEPSLITRKRHRTALEACHAYLTIGEPDRVLGAENIRLAARQLGVITGRVGVEDMLDSLFDRFCIGK